MLGRWHDAEWVPHSAGPNQEAWKSYLTTWRRRGIGKSTETPTERRGRGKDQVPVQKVTMPSLGETILGLL
jgi:hypothetical protein